MIEQCKINVPNHERVIVAQAENMPFESDMFDVIVSQYALHYVAQLDEAYKEIHRVMKSWGIISFVVHHPFKDLACADSKIYGQQQLAKFKLYDNLVEITFPTHTFKDYFSDYFLSCFDVISIVEEQSPEERLEDKLYIVPGYLGVTARKK